MTDQTNVDNSHGEQANGVQPVYERLRRWRVLDDVEGLRRRVTRALRTAEEIMLHEGTETSVRLKACTVVQQTARTALKLLEVDELEARVEALEAAEKARKRQYSHPT